MLTPGQEIALAIEKPASGGRMIGRHDGQVVLVAGAIPGERVAARIDKVERRVAFAHVASIVESSPDRRRPVPDPLCGGCAFSHIAYPRQLAIKAEIVADAFVRIGRLPLHAPVPVADSPEHGYRMRFRLHVSRGRAGFYREGTHQLCDAAATGQLVEGSVARVERLVAVVEEAGLRASSVEVTENIAGDERAMSIAVDDVASMGVESVSRAVVENGLTGCVVHDQSQRRVVAGDPRVSDSLALLTGGRAPAGSLTRHAESFFQGNRFLVADLVDAVLDAMPDSGDVLDLYAGVGLFAVALAAQGRRVTAIEGDPSSGADLQANAAPYKDRLTVRVDSVERAAGRQASGVSTVVLDPPRTGLSPEALTAVAGTRADRVVYVSCDPATMARDARRLLDAGFMLTTLRAFDLFPNTPHIECVGVFDRGAQRSASL